MENTKSKSKKKNEIKENNEQQNVETAIKQKLTQYSKSMHKDDKKMFDDFFRMN